MLKWGKYPVKISRTSELNTSFVMLVCDDEATSSFHTQFPSVSPWQTEAKDNQALENKQSLGLRHHCHLFQVFRTHLYQQALISCFYFDSYFVYSVFVMFLLTHPVFFLVDFSWNQCLSYWMIGLLWIIILLIILCVFCSGYDFGYLIKILSNANLPEEEVDFFEILRLYFPVIYDVKYLMKSCKNLKVFKWLRCTQYLLFYWFKASHLCCLWPLRFQSFH